jgi:hypothetical protein
VVVRSVVVVVDRLVVARPCGDVCFDGERERGEVGVADDLAELALGFEHPGGRPAQAHVAVCQRLTLRLVARQMPIIDSIGFVDERLFQSC